MMTFSKLVRLLLLAQLILLVLPNKQQQPQDANIGAISIVQCSSSYIDDYFLPTAKIAFNKIQQQFTPSATFTTMQTTSETQTTTSTTTTPASASPTKQDERRVDDDPNREPNKNEFVNLGLVEPRISSDIQVGSTQTVDVSSVEERKKESSSRADDDDRDSDTATVVSATESTSVDPTTSLIDSSSSSSSPDEQPEATLASREEVGEKTVEPANTSSSTTSEEPMISNQIDGKTSDESIRETELEAIGAVEASIGFGDSALFGNSATNDDCYDEYGNARYCEPEFENVAYERQVDTSSECGAPASRFCTAYLNERGDQIRNCHICDQQHPKKRHPAAFLTDMNNSNQPTCWVSAPIGATQQAPSNASQAPKRDNVTLTLNFDKRYELTYVSLQFCSLKPDSLAIFKSSDFGKSWTPYQFYSSQCARVYGRASVSLGQQTNQEHGDSSPIEASCLNSSSPTSGQSNNRIAFSTLDVAARAINSSTLGPIEKSQPLQEWMTATNIRVVLDQHQASWIQSSLAHHAHHPAARVGQTAQNATSSQQQEQIASKQASVELESSLTKPSDTYNYAISDLTVGGRCKCNGHASRCVHNADGRLHCDCQHNTDGPDCERCLPLHHDRPWQRATQTNANPCQPCNCNGHSRKCRFDSELYQLSGRRSGGVCIDCKDNTTGRHCHYCKEGFTRDHSRPMSDKEACKPCDCHPVGSVGKVCNQTSGQCPCKEGVTGLECNRCAPGYQQSSSPSEPCIKLPENDINYEPSIEGDEQAPTAQLSASGAQQSNEPAIAPADEDPSIVPQSTQKPSRTGAAAAGDQTADVDSKQPAASNDQDEPDPVAHQPALSSRLPYPKQRKPWPHHKSWHYYPRPRPNYDAPAHDGYSLEDMPDGYIYYPPEYGYAASPNRPFRVRYPKGGRQASSFGVAPIANLDHDQSEDYVGGSRDEGLIYENPDGMNPSYADDASNFNQIHSNNNNNNGPTVRKVRPQSHGFYPLPSRHRGPLGLNDDRVAVAPVKHMGANTINLACAECQPATKRLNFKQFCQLDYAIKATILSRQKANDWTKFEVEIQDIFKSASSSALLLHRSQRHYLTDAPSGGQQAENTTLAQDQQKAPTSNEQAPVSSNSLPILDTKPAVHRALKVGSRQTIWIPTEDVECKCPRLKLHSTYLLMGLVDTKENSATSIQLDRHGVAIEWKARWQEKLVKYQRRHSRGAC